MALASILKAPATHWTAKYRMLLAVEEADPGNGHQEPGRREEPSGQGAGLAQADMQHATLFQVPRWLARDVGL